MNKKIALALMGLALLFTTSCLGTSEKDIADLVGNLLGINSAAVNASQYIPVENVTFEVNEEQTQFTATYENFEVAALLTALGVGEEVLEEIPLTSITGVLTEDMAGNLTVDYEIEGAVVSKISFTLDGATQDIVNLIADDKPYDINDAIAELIEEQRVEAEEAQAAAAAEQSQMGPTLPPAPATEAPATEAPATEAPATEAPATEAPLEAPQS